MRSAIVDCPQDGELSLDAFGPVSAPAVSVRKRFVYILRSDRDPQKHYVGVTSDVSKRLRGHNAGLDVHTARNRPWHVIVSLEFRTEEGAVEFERYLKTGSGRAFAKRHFP